MKDNEHGKEWKKPELLIITKADLGETVMMVSPVDGGGDGDTGGGWGWGGDPNSN